MEILLAVAFGAALASSAWAALQLIRSPRKVLSEDGEAMQAALHAATSTLPHLRRGLSPQTAQKAVPHLRALTQSAMLAIADRESILAIEGPRAARHFVGAPPSDLFSEGSSDRVQVETRLDLRELGLGACVVAPLNVRRERIGSLAAFFASPRRIRPEHTRMVQEAASLVAAQLELAALEEQETRLARAELTALRAQISPHFIYNALSAVAGYIHSQPDHARELLTEFAEFIRYAFRRNSSYVTIAEELRYVEKYLRLERARFGERLEVRLEVAPDILPAVVPVLSLQPLVENAVRHGVEAGHGSRVEILGEDAGADALIRVSDDGAGMDAQHAQAALAGRNNGIGISNVHRRLQSSFGAGYGLAIESENGGTAVTMTIPKSHPGVRAG